MPDTDELALSALFPDITVEEARAAVGWPLASPTSSRHRRRARRAHELDDPARAACAHRRGARAARATSDMIPAMPAIQQATVSNPHIKTELPGPEGARA